MNISSHTVEALGSIITGNGHISPYRSGPELVAFFNQFGANDIYGQGFPSRWHYAEAKLRRFNGRPELKRIILEAIDPRHFLGTTLSVEDAVDHLNQYLDFDGFHIDRVGKRFQIIQRNEADIEVNHPYTKPTEVTHVFIVEQLEKCDKKLAEQDFDGAITNARSLVEAVLTDIERKHDHNPPDDKGNLPRLYRRVQKQLRLSPGQEGLADSLRQILSGLTSVVNGLASLRNSMSDSHVISYRPAEHHARLAVNSAKTLCHFLFDTQVYQESRLDQEEA